MNLTMLVIIITWRVVLLSIPTGRRQLPRVGVLFVLQCPIMRTFVKYEPALFWAFYRVCKRLYHICLTDAKVTQNLGAPLRLRPALAVRHGRTGAMWRERW